MASTGWLLDTNIFNHILDGKYELNRFVTCGGLHVTYVQWHELDATRDVNRRESLLAVFSLVPHIQRQIETAVWGQFPWGGEPWGKKGPYYEKILKALNRKNNGRSSNPGDALIAETALVAGDTLVTDDWHLTEVARAFGVVVTDLSGFLQHLQQVTPSSPAAL
jgi:hypothetical protein